MEQTMSMRSRTTTERNRVMVENVNHPGSARPVDAAKYRAMRQALLGVLPSRPPGHTLADALQELTARLPSALFPGGAHAGWWFKTVQLDLEAKGVIAREKTSPLRIHRARGRR
jgi:hypothetical protein